MSTDFFPFKWEELSTTVQCKNGSLFKTKRSRKLILNNISGVVGKNSLIAILGPSGAGKTTLLSTLSGRTKHLQGRIFVNNKLVDSSNLKQLTGFVYQEFIATQTLTVREYLNFMNALLASSLQKNRHKTITDLAKELNLLHTLNNQLRYLSGGEKKRVAIAAQLLRNPPFLLCDEPLTGLDSYSALNMMKCLSNQVAFGNKLVIMTVHQPSSHIYDYFDQIILITKGNLIFQGTKNEASKFFDSANLQCPSAYNPLDFYITQITDSNRNSNTQVIYELERKYASEYPLERVQLPYEKFIESKYIIRRKNNIWKELKWLIWRSSVNSSRNVGFHIWHFTLSTLTAFIFSLGFFKMSVDMESSVQNFEGLLFLVTTELLFTAIYSGLYTFPVEFAVFSRETDVYGPIPYFLSKVIASLPRRLIECLIFMGIVFIMVDFPNPWILFAELYGVFLVGSITGTTFGLAMSGLFSTLEYMMLVIVIFDTIAMTVAGLFTNSRSLPSYITWIKYLSPFYYTYESISILHWIEVPTLACGNTTLPCYRSGIEVLEFLGFYTSKMSVLYNMLILLVIAFILCVVGYIGIIRKLHKLP